MQISSQDLGHSSFSFSEICGWRPHVGALPDRHQHGGRKKTEIAVTEFCYKIVKSLEELKNVFFYMNCSDSQIPRNKSLF